MQIGILEPEDFSSKAIIKLNQIGKLKFYDGKTRKIFVQQIYYLFGYHIILTKLFKKM